MSTFGDTELRKGGRRLGQNLGSTGGVGVMTVGTGLAVLFAFPAPHKFSMRSDGPVS